MGTPFVDVTSFRQPVTTVLVSETFSDSDKDQKWGNRLNRPFSPLSTVQTGRSTVSEIVSRFVESEDTIKILDPLFTNEEI